MTSTRNPATLGDVLYALALDDRDDRADVLDEYCREYPEHAAELTDFAIELAVDLVQPNYVPSHTARVASPSNVSPAVSRAMSRFQNRLFALLPGTCNPKAEHPGENPFASLDRGAFRTFAAKLDCSTVFAMKLRDRVINPDTMTEGFLKRVAGLLQTSIDTLRAYVTGGLRGPIQTQFFKAEQKPTLGRQQSFNEAVEDSGMTREQKERLLEL